MGEKTAAMTMITVHVDRLPAPESFGLVVVPSEAALSTPDVYRAFDGRGTPRAATELDARAGAARAGPTVFGVFGSLDAARDAAGRVGGLAVEPVGAAFGEVTS